METMDMYKKAEEELTIFRDRCSKFFHSFLKAKRNRTAVSKIKDREGSFKVDKQKWPKLLNSSSPTNLVKVINLAP